MRKNPIKSVFDKKRNINKQTCQVRHLNKLTKNNNDNHSQN